MQLFNQALDAQKSGRLEEAESLYRKIIASDSRNFDALHMLGIVCSENGKVSEAEQFFLSALSVDPHFPPCFHNYGVFLAKQKRYQESIRQFDDALKLSKNFAPVYCDRGISLMELGRLDESLASHNTAVSLAPNIPIVFYNRGNTFLRSRNFGSALQDYDKAITLHANYANAYVGRGGVFLGLGRFDEALSSYDKALALKPDLAEAWNGRGNIFFELKRFNEAFSAYDKAMELKPDLLGVEGARLHTKMKICDWNNFDGESAHLISAVRNGHVNTIPFGFLAIPSSSSDQFQCAKLWVSNRHPASPKRIWRGEQYGHDRIRIAYLSGDFHEHPISYLAAGLFENHDKSRFETTALSIGPDDDSKMRRRLMASFDRFVDVRTSSDAQIADLIRSLEIDLLVDLKGFTQDYRADIFAMRPAPIQINYLGYPGTMGAAYFDYIVADQTVIPETQKDFYSEKIVYLPHCYQVNDRARLISESVPTRIESGLPPTGFVFCCFNDSYKITPDVFDCWMRILKKVEGSVLWLFENNATATNNLRKAAIARGVSAERLIFAKRLPLPDHLARHQCADLFLDTISYTAHTTASDALWTGLPVLTCLGETFAGRVAASLLKAIRLPELVMTTLDDYEQMAINLATHPKQLQIFKHKLAENRLITPLFDTKLFTKHIEVAYSMMFERQKSGLPADHLVVPH